MLGCIFNLFRQDIIVSEEAVWFFFFIYFLGTKHTSKMYNTYLLPYMPLLPSVACKYYYMQGIPFIGFLELTECIELLFKETLNTSLFFTSQKAKKLN